jgi:capsular exopolysaccharide synthesis family protein
MTNMFIKNSDQKPIESILTSEPNFAVIEAYRELRANIGFALPQTGSKVIMVTSSNVGEGKSTTAVNIAATFAYAKSKVLVIDADMRKPTTNVLMGFGQTVGLSDYLSGIVNLSDTIQDTSLPSLKFIQAGIAKVNPSELLASSKMRDTIRLLREVFDYIFIDTPPVCVVADALPIAKLCDGVLLVVRQMVSTYNNVGSAVEKLKFADANIIGMVLNGIKVKNNPKYYKYSKYGYRSYYQSKSYGYYQPHIQESEDSKIIIPENKLTK